MVGHNGVVSSPQHSEEAAADSRNTASQNTVPQKTVRQRRRTTGLLAATAAGVVLVDVMSKVVAVATLEGREPVKLLGGGLYLVLFRNPGAAFSLGTGLTWLLSLITLAVVAVIVRLAPRLRSISWAVGLGLVLGGAVGNLVDRIFRTPGPLHGQVVDFLSLLAPDGSVWPVFNLADAAIVGGGVFLVVVSATGRELDGTRGRRQAEAGG